MDALVAKLQQANWAYHNDQPIMSDDEYDRGLEQLRRFSPSHPFLAVVGAPAPSGTRSVMLPYIMGSQDKARTAEEMARWMKRQSTNQYVVSEKLDGLSVLYTGRHLYLRGDGVKGVDISSFIGALGLGATEHVVRGELILSKAETPAGSIGRSLVNGWVHSGALKELARCHFVAYQVLGTEMTRCAQMRWLAAAGFRVPWWVALPAAAIKEKHLIDFLVERRKQSMYPLDGLVVGADVVPVAVGGGETKNPPDSIAFKMSLDDQKAETTVVGIEWNASRHGMLIPRIQIEPVEIGGATIQWLSGHNAAMVYEAKLGPGARIVIRRSGDVIPTLDSVLAAAPGGAQMPAGEWSWDATKVQARVGAGASAPAGAPAILHALQTLGVDGIGPGLVKKMVDGGFDTMLKLWKAGTAELSACIGAGRAPALLAGLRERRAAAGWGTLLIASNLLPRGVGERKMRVLFDKEADPRRWSAATLGSPAGWSAETLAELLEALPAALEWSVANFPGAGAAVAGPAAAPAAAAPAAARSVVFTGVRDKALEALLPAHGWAVEDTITKKTAVVVTADDAKESGKTKKAASMGIPCMTITQFRNYFH